MKRNVMVMRPSKATTNASRAAAVAQHMLQARAAADEDGSGDESGGGGAGFDSNARIITAEESKLIKQQAQAQRAKEKAAEAEAARKANPVSKAQQRKLAQLEARKQKAAARQEVMATLAAHRVDDLTLMRSSGNLGATPTKRQRLQRALRGSTTPQVP